MSLLLPNNFAPHFWIYTGYHVLGSRTFHSSVKKEYFNDRQLLIWKQTENTQKTDLFTVDFHNTAIEPLRELFSLNKIFLTHPHNYTRTFSSALGSPIFFHFQTAHSNFFSPFLLLSFSQFSCGSSVEYNSRE